MIGSVLVPRIALAAAAAVTVALLSACQPPGGRDIYVVQSVNPSGAGAVDGIVNVTCESVAHPGKTKTVQWNGATAPAPVVGSTWQPCNEGTS